jgi:hypothetical protein
MEVKFKLVFYPDQHIRQVRDEFDAKTRGIVTVSDLLP